MATQLVRGEQIELENITQLEKVMEDLFGCTTPYYVQLYIEQLKNIVRSKQNGYKLKQEDLANAYQYILTTEFGPEYFYRRIETYHQENKKQILKLLKLMANRQQYEQLPTSVDDLKDLLAPTSPLEIDDLFRTLYLEDFFQMNGANTFDEILSEGNKYYFQSKLICVYWFRKLKNLE